MPKIKRTPDEAKAVARAARQLRALANEIDGWETALEAMRVKRYWAVRRARAAGMSYREIARALRLSFQHIYGIDQHGPPAVPEPKKGRTA